MKKNRRPSFRKRHPHIYYILMGMGIVMFWRGVWGLLDAYLFPGIPALSYALSGMAGLAILYANDFSLKELE